MNLVYQFLIIFTFFLSVYLIALWGILKSKLNSKISNKLKNKNSFLAMAFSFIGLFIFISMAVVAYINYINDIIWNYFLFSIANILVIFAIGIYIGIEIKEENASG